MVERNCGVERRKWTRKVRQVELTYRVPNGGSLDHLSEFSQATLANIGRGGICFETSIYIPLIATIQFQVGSSTCKGRRTISRLQTGGKVVWRRYIAPGKYRLGLQFLDIDQAKGFLKELERFNIPVLLGLFPIKNYGIAWYFNEYIPGVSVPKDFKPNH